MKISFNDRSYVSIDRIDSGAVILSVGAKSAENRLSLVVNTVELTQSQINQLMDSIKTEGTDQ